MKNRILSYLLTASLLFGGMAVPAAAQESDESSTPSVQAVTDEVDTSKLLTLYEMDFTQLKGTSDTELKEELTALGWTVPADCTLSMDASLGLHMKRTDPSSTNVLTLEKTLADKTSGKITAADAVAQGYNMKSEGKYYVRWTGGHDGAFASFTTLGASASVLFERLDINNRQKDKAEFYTDEITYASAEPNQELIIEAVVDTKDGNLDGTSQVATITGYINGEKILDNRLCNAFSGAYTSFLQRLRVQLQNGKSGDNSKGVFVKNVWIAKLVDDGASDLDKAAIAIAPQTSESLDAVTANLTLPTGQEDFTAEWSSSNESVISTTGVVTRPADGDQQVTLTATITAADDVTITRTFDVTVKKGEETEPEPAGPIKVTMVGDSIVDSSRYYYPLRDNVVGEYTFTPKGVPSRTAMKDTWYVINGVNTATSYFETEVYQQSLTTPADVIVIMFGTNDSISTEAFIKEHFKADYTELVQSYQTAFPNASIYLCSAPWAPRDGSASGSVSNTKIKTLINPLVKEISQELNVGFIDMYTVTEQYQDICFDGTNVHPNDVGKVIMSRELGKGLGIEESKLPAMPEAEPIEPTDEIDASKLLTLYEMDFTKLDGIYDAELRTELTERGWTVTDTGTLTMDDSLGLYMTRAESGSTATPKIEKVLTDTNGKITAADAAAKGYDMKSQGKYYIRWTVGHNGAFARFATEGTSYINIFARCDINYRKKDQAEFFTPNITYAQADVDQELIIEAVVDTKGGNLSGGEATATVTGYVNGEKILNDQPCHANSGGYTTFLYKVYAQLQYSGGFAGNQDLTKGLYWKDVRIAKLVDDDASELDKAVIAIAPQTNESLNAVTTDLTLPTEQEGCTAVWSSSNEEAISATGAVTRSSDGDQQATLTATITGPEGVTIIRTFDVTVKQATDLQPEMDKITYETLTDEEPSAITLDLKKPLPASFGNGGTITWSSSNTAYIANDGTVTRPSRLESDQTVIMTAVFRKGDAEDRKLFEFIVKKMEGAITIDDDVAALTEELVLAQNSAADKVTTALNLPQKGMYFDSQITWSADPADCPIDLQTGAVTPLSYGDDIPVTLTATFEKNGETRTKIFQLIIPVVAGLGTNYALGKKAEAEEEYSATYTAGKAVDGDRTSNASRWATHTKENSWWLVDLEEPTLINEMHIYEYAGRLKDFDIQYSDDKVNWETAYEGRNYPAVTIGAQQHKIKFEPVKGRYFRLYMYVSHDMNTIYEIELYDTATRRYLLDAQSNDNSLGAVQGLDSNVVKEGEEVTLRAAATDKASFQGWELPQDVTLTAGTPQDAEISFVMPGKNINVQAIFSAKTPPVLDKTEVEFDIYENSANHADITVTLTQNDYTFVSVLCGNAALTEGEEYTRDGFTFTFKKEYLKTLESNRLMIFQMDSGTNPSVYLNITNTHPSITIPADLEALQLTSYKLVDGSVIPAVGPLYGTDISVTASNSSIVSITREMQNGKLVNKISVSAPLRSTLVTLTITGSKDGVQQSVSYKYDVSGTGTGSGSGGSSGGIGGSSSGRGDSYVSGGSGMIDWSSGMEQTWNGIDDQKPTNESQNLFGDMDEAQWAKPYVQQLYEAGIVSGDEDGNFRPNSYVTREEFMKLAILTLGISPSAVSVPFTDVEEGAWYYPYVAAAYQNELVSGLSQDTFGVGGAITRQDAAVILVRSLRALQGTEPAALNVTDAEQIGGYALDSVSRILGAGLMQGYPDGSFRPEQAMTRAETAKVLAELIKLQEEGML